MSPEDIAKLRQNLANIGSHSASVIASIIADVLALLDEVDTLRVRVTKLEYDNGLLLYCVDAPSMETVKRLLAEIDGLHIDLVRHRKAVDGEHEVAVAYKRERDTALAEVAALTSRNATLREAFQTSSTDEENALRAEVAALRARVAELEAAARRLTVRDGDQQ